MPSSTPSTAFKQKVIITSALPYSNGDLHIGHLLEYLYSDTWVRFRKMQGDDCYFFCADDTHGTPIMIAAQKLQCSPETLIAQHQATHLKEFKAFNINFTHYSSTNTSTNKEVCYEFYAAMQKSGALTEKIIQQSYCNNCQMFLPDRFIKGTCPNCKTPDQYGDVCEACSSTYAPEDLINPSCSVCTSTPTRKSSQHLFFNLHPFNSFLQDWVAAHTSNEVRNQLAKWFADGLEAWNISRDAPYFGFEIPDHPRKYFYVWVDAPIGYISTSKEWGQANGERTPFNEHWKDPRNEIVHFIGKDIIYFHALFWPAMLQCAGYPPPHRLFVHGFLTLNGEKMSKSKGTFILARTYLESKLPPDYLRYYFMSKLNGTFTDVDLNLADFKDKINAELIGKLTNLAARSIAILHKKGNGTLSPFSPNGKKLYREAQHHAKAIAQAYYSAKFNNVSLAVRTLAEGANKYFDAATPWNAPPTQALLIASDAVQLFRILLIYLNPILPAYTQQARQLLNESAPSSPYSWNDLTTPLPPGHAIKPYEHLARRVTTEDIDLLIQPA